MDHEARIGELLSRVGTDVSAAAELLGLAAEYLKARKPMPDALADYLARAFHRAASAPESEDGERIDDARIARLAHALGMSRDTGRPRKATPDGEIAATVAAFGDRVSETAMKKALAEAANVSETTALTRIKAAKAKGPEAPKHIRQIITGNGLDSLIPPRTAKSDKAD